MTAEQFKEIGLNVDEINGNAALEWIEKHTTIDINDVTKLSASAKLFIRKYDEIYSMRSGVSSQSIEGLSQSFNSGGQSALVWQAAEDLLGDYLKARVSFVPATSRWC